MSIRHAVGSKQNITTLIYLHYSAVIVITRESNIDMWKSYGKIFLNIKFKYVLTKLYLVHILDNHNSKEISNLVHLTT